MSETQAPADRDVATAFSIVVGLSDNMQITFQSGFGTDESDAAINERIDRLVRVAERQRSIAQIDKLEKDLVQQSEMLAQFREDYERIDLSTQQAIAQREIELQTRRDQEEAERKAFTDEIDGKIAQMQASRDQTYQNGLDEFSRSGRGGTYHPRGATKDVIDKTDRAIAEALAHRNGALADFDAEYQSRLHTAELELDKARSEREEALRSSRISIDRYEAAVANTTTLLEKAREMKGT